MEIKQTAMDNLQVGVDLFCMLKYYLKNSLQNHWHMYIPLHLHDVLDSHFNNLVTKFSLQNTCFCFYLEIPVIPNM